MNGILHSRRFLIAALWLGTACGSGGGGGADGGGIKGSLGDNASVPAACQMCLSTSSGNECEGKGKICTSDTACTSLNECINKCANINAACIANCGDGASQNAIDEWNDWAGCTCDTCSSQCNQTFCNIGGGSGSGSGSGMCVPDNTQCSTTEACCTFCASDGGCGCIPSGDDGCQTNQDCCSNDCEGGTCN
jgi:hypothetical protein